MKKYILETSRMVCDELEFELPDDFDLDEYTDENGIDGIKEIEGYHELAKRYGVEEFQNECYSLTDKDGNIIDEY